MDVVEVGVWREAAWKVEEGVEDKANSPREAIAA